MEYDPEEEWIDDDIVEECQRRVSGSSVRPVDYTWVKNPDGTWSKILNSELNKRDTAILRRGEQVCN